MRRRCCCSDITPHDCFSFWDELGGAADRPGSTITFNWEGGVRHTDTRQENTFNNNPNIYASFTPEIFSGSVELDYIGNVFQSCVWYGEHSRTLYVPHITIPADFNADGSGKYSRCPNIQFSKSFSPVSIINSYRFTLGENSWPYFFSYLMLSQVRDYYDPLTGNWSISVRDVNDLIYLDIDSDNCTNGSCTGFDSFGSPVILGRVYFNTAANAIFSTGFAAGQGNTMIDGPGFFAGMIPPRDIDIPNHKLRVGTFISGNISRSLCTLDNVFQCTGTKCSPIGFGWGMRSPDSTQALPAPLTGYLEW